MWLYAVRPADFRRFAWSAVSIPSVVHTSMPNAATSATILSTASNAAPSCTSRQAAPMQKRVDPFSRAMRAASSTASGRIIRSRPTPVCVVRALRTIRAVFGASAGLDAEQRAALHRLRIVVLTVDRLRAKEQLGQRKVIKRFDRVGGPIVANHGGFVGSCRAVRRVVRRFAGSCVRGLVGVPFVSSPRTQRTDEPRTPMIVQTTSSYASGTRLTMRTSSVSPSSSAERVAGGPSAILTA